MSQYGAERRYSPGQFLANDTEKSGSLFLIWEGQVKLTKTSCTGKEQTIQIYGSGELVGMFTLFTGSPFPADAIALEKCRVLIYSRKHMEQAAQRIPSLMVNLFYALSMCMNECMQKVEFLTLKEIPQRLAAFLLLESQKEGKGNELTLTYSYRELSKIIGTTPETLSRILTRFSQEQLIAQDGRRIRIMNRSGLENMDGETVTYT